MVKILITAVPFGELDREVLNLLSRNSRIEFNVNTFGRKLTEQELIGVISGYDIVIAGTETYTRRVMENAPKLKLISRVGIGLDSVDLEAADELGIIVSYTPDAPAPAVAELTIAQMINLSRKLPLADRKLREGQWKRYSGLRLSKSVIGIIGTGRVGSIVLKHLQTFNPEKIFVNDIVPNFDFYRKYNAELVEKEIIYKESDIITLHIPLTNATYKLISKKEMYLMKKNVCLINTSRGAIINEEDLYEYLFNNPLASAALDVFEKEPYKGILTMLDNCIFTCHMGSMAEDCRINMEIEAVKEAIRLVNGESLKNLVTEEARRFQFRR
ncbi:MAG: lactate dehydrogenase [Ignavibacteria bacterium RIFOXYB2_FULL_35_12]|nr:MAG: lactate dehydrogenase [Ignavibacteria bacterium GWA2_36_19]OGU55118.1 MAG: lactate dehydrogenase [Ignavibacteria bacterium GWC2_35_8]OGU61345.1 MAG: lactate dehydrogenase [Ignavibacteria bacterium GWF2_35_20]OGU88443.1 MAG: lactate dehydrogenase [Ignavibacteria bacterium RIFOXYA12_FULL_35_25]OGU92470.1 MAG: lactate dehydrogenase [Ignavibacteria bacterium RIFOXYC12_FULL_35_11]OGU95847.1 MAG: lactate dehydrogenase [Ignavibacteria bacterium RIFOXYB12_FULL_35_14]OGV00914.1 MAG: lactate de